MSEGVKLRTRAEIDEEAATWIWRMDCGPDGGADPEGFEAWLRQDPRHRRAYEELTKVWNTLDGLPDPRHSHPVPPRRRGYWWLAVAATVVAAGAGASWLLYKGNEIQTLATAVGQHR